MPPWTISNRPEIESAATVGSPTPKGQTASASLPASATGTPRRHPMRVCCAPYPNRGSTFQLIATVPPSPSTFRTISRNGTSPAEELVIASVRRTAPDAVENVVRSTVVPGM